MPILPTRRHFARLVILASFANLSRGQVRIPGPGGIGGAASSGPTLINWSNASNTARTPAVNMSGANFLVAAVVGNGGESVSDSAANTWVPIPGGGSMPNAKLFYVQNPIVTQAMTFSQSNSSGNMLVAGFSGMATNGVFETGTNLNNEASTGQISIQPGAPSPTSSANLVITGLGAGSGAWSITSVDSGFALVGNIAPTGSYYGAALAYRVINGPASINPTWTVANATIQLTAIIASFTAK